MTLNIAGILFAETGDMREPPPAAAAAEGPAPPPTNELATLRRSLADLVIRSGDGIGFAAPEVPTAIDFGDPKTLAAWQDCSAAAANPIAHADLNVAFFSTSNPQNEAGLLEKYPWLRDASPPIRAARVQHGNVEESLWLTKSGAESGRFPRNAKTLEYSAIRPVLKSRWAGAVVFLVCLALLIGPAIWIGRFSNSHLDKLINDACPAQAASVETPPVPVATPGPKPAACSAEERIEDLDQANVDLATATAAGSKTPDDAKRLKDAQDGVTKKRDALYGETPKGQGSAMIVVPWVISMAGIVSLLILVSWALRREAFGFLVDERGRMSLSRFQFIAWTVVILSAYWAAAAWNMGAVTKLTGWVLPSMSTDLWILLGIVTTSPLVSALVIGAKAQVANPTGNKTLGGRPAKEGTAGKEATPKPLGVAPDKADHKGLIDTRVGQDAWSFVDLFIGEEVKNRDSVDISRVQQFIFTLVTLLAFVSLTLRKFATLDPGIRIVQLPALDLTLIGLLAVSHAAYLAAKTVPKS